MRALVLGEGGPGALADSYARALIALGWEVVRYCDKRAWREALAGAQSRVAEKLFFRWIAPLFNRKVRRDLEREVPEVDLVLVVKGRHLSRGTIEWLSSRFDAPVVNLYPDDPFSSRPIARPTYGVDIFRAYDHCFTFAKHLIPAYRQARARGVSYLPFARDPDLHAPPSTAREPEFDLVFVGNCNELGRIRCLESVAHYRMAVFSEEGGRKIPRGSRLEKAVFLGPAYGRDMAAALSRGKVSLNVMRCQNRLSHNMRSFESPACGAFTLSQRTPELLHLFEDGFEIASFGDGQDLVRQVDFWLSRDEERELVAYRGFRRVEHDTYRVRAEQMIRAAHLDR